MNISRRNLLTLLPFLPALGAAAAAQAARPPARRYHLNRFSIAGFAYYAGPQLLALNRLQPGQTLTLTAEPDHRHDHYAVRIDLGDAKLGYVPRSDNRHLSRLLRQGAELDCRIIAVNPEDAPWRGVRVAVGMVGG
jgi:hypothetical protein